MKGFTIALVGIIFVVLIACSVQSISADHTEPGKGIFVDADNVDIITTQNSNYQIYLQTVLRNADGQLINVTESTENGAYVPHKITDNAFDTSMGKKKIVTVDGIKYEKVQFYDSYKNKALWDTGFATGSWIITMCEEKCLNIFQARNVQVVVEGEDVVTVKWTILRDMN